MWTPAAGIEADPEHGSAGDYDAIRVYLWLGMLARGAAQRDELLRHYAPMVELTTRGGQPPESVDARTGKAIGHGPIGFSAALLPLLASTVDGHGALEVQRKKLRDQPVEAQGYYDHVLSMFGRGWDEDRYRFDNDGRLLPAWSAPCSE
ncbi:Endoglucanase precursor [compost metagenome]